MIYPNYCSVLAIRRFGILVCLTFLAIDLPRASGASFTWGSASLSGSWSNSTQWSPTGVPSISDSAILGNTGGLSRVVTYDALASGAVGTLSFVQTSSGTNTLLFQGGKDLVDSASLTLTGSSGGVSELRMVSNGLSLNVSAPSLTINSGGLLTLTTGSANTNSPQFNGSITLSGGWIQASQGVVGSVAQENVGGPFSMTSGTISLSGSTFLAVSGAFTSSGGTITMTSSTSGGELCLFGSSNSFTSTTLSNSVPVALCATGTQTLTVASTLNAVIATSSGTTVKIISTPGFNYIGPLVWSTSLNSGSTTVRLVNSAEEVGSTVNTPLANTVGPSVSGTGFYILDVNGHFLYVNSSNNALPCAPSQAAGSVACWSLISSANGGRICATGYTLSLASQVNVGPGLMLQSTGTNAIDVSGGGTIDPTSVIQLTGTWNSTQGTYYGPMAATLSSTNRNIGNLNVGWGLDTPKLTLASNIKTGGNSVFVQSGSTLDLADFILDSATTIRITVARSGTIQATGTGSLYLEPGCSIVVTGTGTGKAIVSSAICLNGSANISAALGASGTDLILSGPIRSSTSSNGFYLTDAGTVVLNGSNNYTGVTQLNDGILNLGNANAIPSGGIITFGGGILQYSSSNHIDYSAYIKNSTSPIVIDTNGQNITFATPLSASNTGGFVVTGTGSLLFSSTAVTLTGTTTVSAGTLHYPGNLTMSSSSTLVIGVGGTSAGLTGQVLVGGTTTLGGDLILTGTTSLLPGTSVTIIPNVGIGGILGTFKGMAEGAVFTQSDITWTITYKGGTGHDVVVTVVPTINMVATINASALAWTIPSGFAGFSMEINSPLTWAGYPTLNSGMAQLMNNLAVLEGPPVLRIGGNSQDTCWYQPAGTPTPTFNWYQTPLWISSFSDSTFQSLAAMNKATGCPLTIGLNLGANNVNIALAEIAAAQLSIPSSSILTYDVGNEPDQYYTAMRPTGVGSNSWNPSTAVSGSNYAVNESSFLTTIRANYPSIPLACGDLSWIGWHSWMPPFDTTDFNFLMNTGGTNISFFSVHWYAFDGNNPPPNAAAYLLTPACSSIPITTNYPVSNGVVAGSGSFGHLCRMNETGSAYGDGAAGISNAMAGGLWSLDILGCYATAGFCGVNFHGTQGGAGVTGAYYAPIGVSSSTTGSSTTFTNTAWPTYYGMYFFSKFIQNMRGAYLGATGTNAGFLPAPSGVSVTGSGNMTIYSSRDSGGTLRVLVINKSACNSATSTLIFTNASNYNLATGNIVAFQSPANSLYAKTGLTVGGQSFDMNGNLVGSGTSTTVTGTALGTGTMSYSFPLTPASAVIFTLDPNIKVSPKVHLDMASLGVSSSDTTVAYTATPSGTAPFTFQWFLSGTAILGGTTPRLVVPSSGPYTVQVSNAAGLVTGALITTTYAGWKGQSFTSAQQLNATMSGDAATPSGDGISNLMKYALGLNPNRISSGSATLPHTQLLPVTGTNHLMLTFTYNTNATDLAYLVEASSDLTTWTSINPFNLSNQFSVVANPGAGTETLTIVDVQPASSSQRRFMRLKIIGP